MLHQHDPERPVEPREPEVFAYCRLCSAEIYLGKHYYRTGTGDAVCSDCAENLLFSRSIAGDDG